MKKYIRSLIFIIALILLVGCNTLFTNKQYNYLKNPDNYHEYTVKFQYFNAVESQTSYRNTDVYINVTFESFEELKLFSPSLENVSNLDDYPITFTIHAENSSILYINNFYTEIEQGQTLSLWVCKYSGKNRTYQFVSCVKFNGVEYLSKEDGMKGIISYLDEHRSPFFR